MHTLGYQVMQGAEKLLLAVFTPDLLLGDLMVLAEEAAARASREKHSARAFFPSQAWLLPEMRKDCRDAQSVALPAEAHLPR